MITSVDSVIELADDSTASPVSPQESEVLSKSKAEI